MTTPVSEAIGAVVAARMSSLPPGTSGIPVPPGPRDKARNRARKVIDTLIRYRRERDRNKPVNRKASLDPATIAKQINGGFLTDDEIKLFG